MASSPSRPAILCVLLAFLVGVVACLARDPAGLPLTLDNQHYFFIAERAASGVPPHASHFDPKHQAAMLATAVAIRLGRELGIDDVHSARVASIAATAGAVALAWGVAHAITGSFLAGHLAALALLWFDGFLLMGAMGARPKVFLVFFQLATAWAVARRRAFWAGGFSALAFLCWQPALLTVAAAMAALTLSGGARRRGWVRFLAGVALPILLYEAYFAAHGALGVQLEQAYRFPARYMTPDSTDVWRHAVAFFQLGDGLSVASLLPLAFAGILAGCAAWAAVRPARCLAELRERPGLGFVLLCGAASLAFSLYEYQTYIDGFLVLPYVVVVVGSVVAVGVGLASRRLGPAGRLAAAGATVLLFAAPAQVLPARAFLGMGLADQQRLAGRVRAMLAEGGGVYAVGCTHLLAMNHADNHVPFGFFFRGMDAYLAERHPAGYRPEREGGMPERILVSRPFVPGGRHWLEEEYRDETPAGFRLQGIRVWRLRSPAGELSPSP